jgi:hypothetical protein
VRPDPGEPAIGSRRASYGLTPLPGLNLASARKSLARNRKSCTGVAATKLLLKPMLGLALVVFFGS